MLPRKPPFAGLKAEIDALDAATKARRHRAVTFESSSYDDDTLADDLQVPLWYVQCAREQLDWLNESAEEETPALVDQGEKRPRAPVVCFRRSRRLLLINLREEGYDFEGLPANDNGVPSHGRLSAAFEVARCQKMGLVEEGDIARALRKTLREVRRAVNDLRYAPSPPKKGSG